MNQDDEWHNVAAEIIYNLDIITAHYINELSPEEMEVIWKTVDLMKKVMKIPMKNTYNQ